MKMRPLHYHSSILKLQSMNMVMQKYVQTKWEHSKNQLTDFKGRKLVHGRGSGELNEEAYFCSYATIGQSPYTSKESMY
jgi:hypothetical protein